VAETLFLPFDQEPQDTQNDGRPPDWEAREHALDVKRSWIVEAPAGSGKTGLLIQRYLKLLGDESVMEPEQVLAITFTKKATTEMRDRVLAQLEAAARNEPVKSASDFERDTRALAEAVLRRDRALGWGLLEHPRRLKMQTIDSVCGEIARTLPILTGAGGRQTPVEDATPLYGEATRLTLMQLGGEDAALDEALRTVLLHRDGNLRNCEQLLVEMLALRNQWGELVPLRQQELDDTYLDGTILPRLERALEQSVCAGLTRFADEIPADLIDDLAQLAAEMGHAEGYKGKPSPIAICAGRPGAPGESAEDFEHWRALVHLITKKDGWRVSAKRSHVGFEITSHHEERLQHLIERLRGRDDLLAAVERFRSLPPLKYPQEQWRVAKALFRVLRHALAELQVVFARQGECDFAELELLAKAALGEGAVADLVAARGMDLRHLLIDEMQDTSTSQYELIELLTEGWDGHGQTVFLVGDPKQSIYLFRQARVERFVRTMREERLGELPVGCLRLSANFRSQRELVGQFNDDFSLLFPRAARNANPDEVPYVEAIPVKDTSKSGGLGVVWHTNVLPHGLPTDEARRSKRRQAKLDAQKVRAIAKEWLARPLPEGRSDPWKIAVLVRSRIHLMDIVAALKEDDGEGAIPYRAVKIETLGERQEVLDLFALTRALLHPADRVAWLALLRAPWCGLGLTELHVLTGADDSAWEERSIQNLIEERGDLLSEESIARLARLWPVLSAAAEQRSKLTMAQLVERTWRSLGGDAYLTHTELANGQLYLQLLDEAERLDGGLNLNQLKHRLGQLFAETAASDGAVDLMTIHGAKGLEWDVVIVPCLERPTRSNQTRLLTWSEFDSADQETAHIVLAPIAGKGERSRELNDWLRSVHNAREEAERKRLFYVACTRAREELHLFASPQAKANGSVNLETGSLLSTAWPSAERRFLEAAPESDAAAKVFVMPSAPLVEDDFVGDLAAEAEEPARPPVLLRLPLSYQPGARFETPRRLSYGETESAPSGIHFDRPEGSFEARAFGNAVHAFVETITKRFADGLSVNSLLREVAGWGPRIAAVLRGDGLPPNAVERLAARAQMALNNMLRDAEGLWVLAAREEASSEYPLTSWTESRRSVRLDRVFRAGTSPIVEGSECLWIVDYKTTTHGRGGVEEFLAGEREKYGPQMEAYARMVAAEGEVRVGLYYPMLPRLVWWTPEKN
jgi:ATP-dependent helicase/nuclease subunit A